MATYEKLKDLEKVIKPILEKSIGSRNDDFYLYAIIIEYYYPQLKDVPLVEALTFHSDLGLPSYETVSRVRRKVQEKYPHLASEKVKARRAKEQEVYKEYGLFG